MTSMNDTSIVQDGQTAYLWGGWGESGFHSRMLVVDMQTGASRLVPFGQVKFLAQGFVTNPAWSWTPGKLLYLWTDGTMSQTRPTLGVVTILGIAYSATTICFDPRPPKEDLGGFPDMWTDTLTDFFTDAISDFYR